jgi:multicomponent Na+:H+ antiporter subunit F
VSGFLGGMAIFVTLLIGANFYRVMVGPTIFDRLLGVGATGTNAVLLLALLGFIYGRPDGFLDLAITYAILNFIGVVAVARYVETQTARQRAEEEEGPELTSRLAGREAEGGDG